MPSGPSWAPSSTGARPRWRPCWRTTACTRGTVSSGTGARRWRPCRRSSARCAPAGSSSRSTSRRPTPRWRTSCATLARCWPSPMAEHGRRFEGIGTVLRIDELVALAGRPRPGELPEPRTERRRAHRLHLGHDRHAQGRGAHPRVAPGRGRGTPHRLGVGPRGPADPQPAALPRARVVCGPLRVPGGRGVGHRLRSFRRGQLSSPRRRRAPCSSGCPTMYHRLAATPDVGALGSLRLCVSGSAPLAVDLWHRPCRRRCSSVLERYGMTETLLTLSNPRRRRTAPGLCRGPVARCRGCDRGSRRARRRRVARTWPDALSAVIGDTGRLVTPDGWFATGDLVSVADDGYVTHPGPAHRPHHHRRAQRLSRRGRGGPGPPPRRRRGGGRRRAVGRSGARRWWLSSSAIRAWTRSRCATPPRRSWHPSNARERFGSSTLCRAMQWGRSCARSSTDWRAARRGGGPESAA